MFGETIPAFYVEIEKLEKGLMDRNISFTSRKLFDGFQVITDDFDAVCHSGSYGNATSKLEIMGKYVENEYDDVEGYLTAEEILRRIDAQ